MSRGKYFKDTSMKGMGGFLKNDRKLQEALTKTAERGKEYAESIAPVKSGEYAASFHVSDESFRKDSVGANLYNEAPHAAQVEYGGAGTLGRTADHLDGKRRRS